MFELEFSGRRGEKLTIENLKNLSLCIALNSEIRCDSRSKREAAIRLLRIFLDFVSDQSIEFFRSDQPDRAVGIDSHAHLSSCIPTISRNLIIDDHVSQGWWIHDVDHWITWTGKIEWRSERHGSGNELKIGICDGKTVSFNQRRRYNLINSQNSIPFKPHTPLFQVFIHSDILDFW